MSEPLEPDTSGNAREVVAELKRRQKYLKRGLAGYKNVHIQFDKPEAVLFQAVLARGDRRLAPVLVEMAKRGTSFYGPDAPAPGMTRAGGAAQRIEA